MGKADAYDRYPNKVGRVSWRATADEDEHYEYAVAL